MVIIIIIIIIINIENISLDDSVSVVTSQDSFVSVDRMSSVSFSTGGSYFDFSTLVSDTERNLINVLSEVFFFFIPS
jgi:hypothetical protein